MRKNVVVLMACLFSVCTSAQSLDEVKQRIAGTWKIVSSQQILKNGQKSFDPVLGAHGKGFLIYSSDGNMCAALMNPDRPAWHDKSRPTDSEKLSAFDGFFAYCGKYEIDVEKHVLVHLPEISMTQDFIGTRQIRPYRFDGARMILGDKEKDDPEVESWQIVWEKVE